MSRHSWIMHKAHYDALCCSWFPPKDMHHQEIPQVRTIYVNSAKTYVINTMLKTARRDLHHWQNSAETVHSLHTYFCALPLIITCIDLHINKMGKFIKISGTDAMWNLAQLIMEIMNKQNGLVWLMRKRPELKQLP